MQREGEINIEMQFMADVNKSKVQCKKFKDEVLTSNLTAKI